MIPRLFPVVVLSSALALNGLTGHAWHDEQHHEGTRAIPEGACGPLDDGLFSFPRTLLLTAARLEPIPFRFAIHPRTRGQRFVLAQRGSLATADLDIVFSGPTPKVFETRALGGETGRVPKGATHARVCNVAGPPSNYTYVARYG